jgi:hypothetical protein
MWDAMVGLLAGGLVFLALALAGHPLPDMVVGFLVGVLAYLLLLGLGRTMGHFGLLDPLDIDR